MSSNVTLNFRASNLLEVEIGNYSEYNPLTATMTFLFPLFEKNTNASDAIAPFGYNFTITSPIEAFMTANKLVPGFLQKASNAAAKFSFGFKITLLSFLIISLFTKGMNWVTLSSFQKLFLLIFINFTLF